MQHALNLRSTGDNRALRFIDVGQDRNASLMVDSTLLGEMQMPGAALH